MSVFFRDFSKPGPGIPPNAPRKKGISRWLEIAGRDHRRFWCAGALTMMSMIPLIFAQILQLIPMLVMSALGGMLAAPQLCGLADTVLRSLRDEPYFWWYTYRQVWKRNAKATLIPGAVWGIITGMQLFTLIHFFDAQFSLSTIVVLIVGLVVIQGIFLWVWPQLAVMEVSGSAIFKNAVLLFMSSLGRSLSASLLAMVSAALTALFMPYALVVLLIFNIWPVMTAVWLIFYRRLDNAFHIESSIKENRATKTERSMYNETL